MYIVNTKTTLFNELLEVFIFWDSVKTCAKEKALSIKSLAEMTGINYRTLQNQMSRDISPDVYTSVKIAQALGTSVEFLVTGEESRPDIRELQELKTKYEALAMTIKGIASTL